MYIQAKSVDFYLQVQTVPNILLVLIYINNIAVSGLGSQFIILFKTILGNNFEITNLSELKFILEILISHDYANCPIFLNQLASIH